MTPEPWRITLLGGLRAERGDQVITRFKYQKAGGMLAYMAYYPGQMHAREFLVELFWPDIRSPEAARNNVSVVLSSLRHQFEPPGASPGTVLRADRYSVGLNPVMIRTDVQAFEQAILEARRVESEIERLQLLEWALDLYKGRLLPGYYEEWIGPEQERLAGLYYDTVALLLGELEQQGDLPEALRYARQAVSLDPLREESYPALMRLLTASGQPGAALRQYKELERLLDEEMGEEPSAPLRALARQIEKQSGLAAAVLVAPVIPRPDASVRSLIRSAGHPDTLTFLLTDLEGVPYPAERTGVISQTVLAAHYALLRSQFTTYGGQEIKETGGGFVVAFQSVKKAVECAVACQQALGEYAWPQDIATLRVRMALHTGDAQIAEDRLDVPTLRRASRILTAAHGGQILLSNTTAELIQQDPIEGTHLQDLGLYRLRDISTPERLYHLAYPAMPEGEFPTPAAEAGYHSYLPVQVTRFFGREIEIAQIMHLLREEQVRLLTLTGTGGTGKTRLAIEAAEKLVSIYQGAVWFAPLAELSDPKLIAGTILDVLRLSRSPNLEPLEQVIEAFNRQPGLLVLDNFEHLLEEGAELIQTLLLRVPALPMLVTSRQMLGLSGEREFPVAPLPVPNGGEEPAQLSLYDSVRLFVDRAQAVLPHFQVTNHNAPALAELCQRLEGIPLAIELAAARTQVLTPFQMLAQLSDRFHLLTSRKRDVSERQRTLRGAIEWSYRLLAPELQHFFTRLSVFRGGWTVEAAEEVCEEPLALDYLAQLRECSLVLTDDSGPQMRFRMLETLREYAAELLKEAAEEAAWQKRHTAYFVVLAERIEPELSGSEQAEWLEQLEKEHDNFRRALTFCRENPEEAQAGLRFGAALKWFWRIRGHFSEGREHLAALLALPLAQEHTKARAEALRGAGELAWRQADYTSSRSLNEDSLTIYRELGDEQGIAAALNNQGTMAYRLGDYADARSFYEEALSMNEEAGNREGQAGVLINLGNLARNQGDYALARSLYQDALDLFRTLEDREGIANTLHNLGNIAFCQNDRASARSLYEESLAIRRELGDQQGVAQTVNNLGNLAYVQGDYATARALFEESLAIKRDLGDKRGIAVSLSSLGAIGMHQSDAASARSCYEDSLNIFRELGDQEGMATCLDSLGIAAIDQGDYSSARSLLEEGLALRKELGNLSGVACSLSNLAVLARKQGDNDLSRSLQEESLQLYRQLGDNLGRANSLCNLSLLAIDEGDYPAARALAEKSLTIRRELADKRGIAELLEAFAVLAMKEQQPERAIRLWSAAKALREEIGNLLLSIEHREQDRYLIEIKEAHGEVFFTREWSEGRAMSLEEAITYALQPQIRS